MEDAMPTSTQRLPERFPVGTKYVIEGRPGQVPTRFIEFPDGTKLRLPKRAAPRRSASAGRRTRIKGKHSH